MRRLLLLLSTLACVATSPPEPDSPPPPAVSVPPAAEPVAKVGHCDEVLFQCPVGEKWLAVCGSASPTPWIQYLYGTPDAPELTFPATREGSVARFDHEERTHVRSMGNALVFENEGWRYEVMEMIGGGGIPDEAAMNNFTGVMLYNGDELVSSLACTGDATSDWEAIAALLP